jgi:hypothetical protein
MALAFFVDGRRVNPYAPGVLVSTEAIAELHGEDFVRSVGAEMFRRLSVEQQAAVVQAWSDAYSAQPGERNNTFKASLRVILETTESPELVGV